MGNPKPVGRKGGALRSKKSYKRQAKKAGLVRDLAALLPQDVIEPAAQHAMALFEQFARGTDLGQLPVYTCPVEPDKVPAIEDYTPEIGLWTAQRYARGDKTLLQICATEKHFPSYAAILRWINTHPEFAEWWRFACKARARVYVDLMIPAILSHTQIGGDPVYASGLMRLAQMRIKYLEGQARCLDPEGFGTVNASAEQPAMNVMIVSPERPKTIEEWVEQCKTLDAEVVE